MLAALAALCVAGRGGPRSRAGPVARSLLLAALMPALGFGGGGAPGAERWRRRCSPTR